MNPREKRAKQLAETSEKMYSVSFFGQYITSFLTFLINSGAAIQAAGKVFPPIAYAFDGLRAFFNLFTGKETGEITPQSPSRAKTRTELYASRAANATVLLLDVIIVLALAGVLFTSPIGWAIAAVATFVGWVGDAVIPAWRARQEYLATGAEQAKQHYLQKRNEAIWGLVAVVGMALFACGPFGFATLGLIGGGLFILLAVRGIVNAVSNWREKRKQSRMVHPELVLSQNTEELKPILEHEKKPTVTLDSKTSVEKAKVLTSGSSVAKSSLYKSPSQSKDDQKQEEPKTFSPGKRGDHQ